MVKLTDRTNRIKPSLTLEMTARAADLKRAGNDVINLSVGEPDFNTPEHIVEAAHRAMRQGFTRYTPAAGMMELREAVTVKLARDNAMNLTPEEVIVSNGAKHSLFNAMMVLFDAGDEVILFSPYWVSYPDMVRLTDATPVIVSTNPAEQFEPVFDELEDKITTRTRGIVFCSPSNPTGGVWSRSAIEHLIDIAISHDIWLFSDECYERLVYDGEFISPATLASGYEKILTFQSCSKTYAMTGWRIGYMAGEVQVVAAMSKFQGQSTSCPNSVAQMAAIAALTGDQSASQAMKTAFAHRRDLVMERLAQIPGLHCQKPGGAFYVFPDVSHYLNTRAGNRAVDTPSDLTEYLLEQALVVAVSGAGFGDDRHIRLSYAASEDALLDGCNRLEAALKRLN